MPDEAPKLIIDSDWKSQAQAEKAKLEQQTAQRKAEAEGEGGEGGIPEKLGFGDLVGMLTMQALSYMGAVPDPRTGQAMISLEYARLHIDMLGILEEKTKGNLSAEEGTMLTKTLSELRMQYVEIQQAVAKAVAEGRIKPMAGGPMAGGMGGAGGMAGGGLKVGAPGTAKPKASGPGLIGG